MYGDETGDLELPYNKPTRGAALAIVGVGAALFLWAAYEWIAEAPRFHLLPIGGGVMCLAFGIGGLFEPRLLRAFGSGSKDVPGYVKGMFVGLTVFSLVVSLVLFAMR